MHNRDFNMKVLKRIQYLREETRYIELLRDVFRVDAIDQERLTKLHTEYTQLIKQHPTEAEVLPNARPVKEQLATFGNLARHDFPMLDYRPATQLGHIRNWLNTVDDDTPIITTPYHLGCRIELIYQGGVLHRALTKGGGSMGHDITLSAYMIDGIPQRISETERVSIRGVVTMDPEVSRGFRVRQLISKTLIDPNIITGPMREFIQGAVFIPDDVHIPGTAFSTMNLRSILQAWDMRVPVPHTFPANRKETGYLDEKVVDLRMSYVDPLPLVGWLFQVDDPAKRMELGYTSLYPEWAILLKEENSNDAA